MAGYAWACRRFSVLQHAPDSVLVWVAGGAGPCLLLLGSSVVAHGLQHDVELQRLRHVLPPLLELVADGE